QADCERSEFCLENPSNRDGCYLDREGGHCDDGTDRITTAGMVVGLSLIPVGLLAVIQGAIVLCRECTFGPSRKDLDSEEEAVGRALVIGGASGILGLALPLAIVGGVRLPREDDRTPTISLHPAGVSLDWD